MYCCSLSGADGSPSPGAPHVLGPRRSHHRPPEAHAAVRRPVRGRRRASSAARSPGRCRPRAASPPRSSGSARADARIEAATGTQAAPGVVALMTRPDQAAAGARRARRRSRGSRRVSREPVASRDGRSAYLLATLKASADEDGRRRRARAALRGQRRRPARRPAVRPAPDRRLRLRGPRPRRDARLPDPAAALAAVLPRPRDGAPARGRHDHRARHVPRADVVNQAYTSRSSRSTS